MKTVDVLEFVKFLDDLPGDGFEKNAVEEYLHGHRFAEGAFDPFIFFQEERYARNLVRKTPDFELIVLAWLPGQRTPIHDHNGQRCWMILDTGVLSFRNYKPMEKEESPLVPVGAVGSKSAGDTLYIDDKIGLHSITNASSKPAVSIHLYAKPVPRCRIYNEATRRLEWMETSYFTEFDGAWEEASAAAP